MAATRTYSQNQQKQAEQEKKNTEQTAIAELQAKGGEDWNKYQNSNNEAEKQELLKNNSPSYKQASETAQDWGMGGDKSRAVNAVAMAVTGALGGQTDLQVAANTLSFTRRCKDSNSRSDCSDRSRGWWNSWRFSI